MKVFYKLLLLVIIVFCYNLDFNSYSALSAQNKTTAKTTTLKVKAAVNALTTSISASSTSACLNGTRPTITFKASNGVAPYTITYTLNSGNSQTIITGSGDSCTITVPTTTAGTFLYSVSKVTDANSTSQTISNVYTTVTVYSLPTITTSTTNACLGGYNISLSASGTAATTSPWVSSNTAVATVNSSGLVSPSSTTTGQTNIIYTDNHGCTATQTITVNPLPAASFTHTNNVCASTPIQFTSSVGGSGAYTYAWVFGDNTTSTAQNPSHQYSAIGTSGSSSYYAYLTVKNDSTGCSRITSAQQVTVLKSLDASLSSTIASSLTNNGATSFMVCGVTTPTDIDFTNKSTTTTYNTNYTIDWGDGTTPYTATSFSDTIYHQYNLGLYTLTMTVNGNAACSGITTYQVFVGDNPAVSMTNPGSTSQCITNAISFPISGTASNPANTTYVVSFNDGSTSSAYTQTSLPSSITHTFLETSCGTTSGIYPNSFYAQIVATDICGSSNATVMPIYISTPPKASYALPSTNVCTNVPVTLTNTSTDGTQASSTGCNAARAIWKISGTLGTDYTISGSMGSDNGKTNFLLWTPGTTTLTVTFLNPGTYTVTIIDRGSCAVDTMTKTICVAKPLSPQFTVDKTSACIGATVTTTNTTTTSGLCTTPTYTWTVSYASNYCGTSSSYSYANGTSASTTSPAFTFNNPGKYTLNLTTYTAECGTQVYSLSDTIKQAPTVTIDSIGDYCGSATVTPVAVVNSCTPSSSTLAYTWGFPGANTTTSGSASPGAITYSSPGNYKVSLSVANECGAASSYVKFNVDSIPVTNSLPRQTTCSNVPTSAVTLGATPSTGTTFAWTGTATGGATGYIASGTGNIPSQIITNTEPLPSNVIYTIIPTYKGCTGSPVNDTITVKPQPVITTQPASEALCYTGTMTALTVGVTQPSTTDIPTYQWYQNTVNSTSGGTAVGTNSSSYLPPNNGVGITYYYCIISFGTTNCASDTSAIASVTITNAPSFATQPTAGQTVCIGGTISTPLTATYQDGAGTPSYQWYDSSGSITGATDSIYTPNVYTTTGTNTYHVIIALAGSGCSPITSNNAVVTVIPDPVVNTQPLPSQTVCQSTTPTELQVTVSGGVTGGTYRYQWYQNSSNSTSGGTLISNATDSVYTPSTSATGTIYYYCVITEQNGPGCDVTSNTAAVIVNPGPTFTTQPVSSNVCVGGTPTTLTVAYTGGVGTPAYQWYSNTTNSSIGGTPVGTNSNSYSPPATTAGTTYYYCTISLAGNCSLMTSYVATVNVNALPTATIPMTSQQLCVGATISSPLSVSYSGGAGTATYQWFSNGSNTNSGGTAIAGATGSTYTPPVYTTPNSYYYYATVTLSGSGCGSTNTNPSGVAVVADPVISTTSASSQSYCQGADASALSISVSGGIGTYSYQWYYSAANTNSGGAAISGATSSSFTPSNATVGTAYYYCTVTQTGLGCGATSNPFTIITNQSPSLSTQPVSSTVCLGNTPATLTVASSYGVGTPTYQWYSNTVNSTSNSVSISGATNSSYLPASIPVGTTYYYCVITFPTGGCNSVVSDIAKVTINPVPVIADTTALIISGSAFSITPVATGTNVVPSGTTYKWTTPVISPSGAITGASAQTSAQTVISQTLTNNTSTPATATYTVTPTAGSCPGTTFKVVVTVNPAITVTTTITNCTCYGSNNGSIAAVISGGVPFTTGNPQIISWKGPNGFTASTATISNLAPGSYQLTVTDAGGFPYTNKYTITQPNDIVITTSEKDNVSCNGAGDGKISISVTGGTTPYTYSWTKNGTAYTGTTNLTSLTPGIYQVTVADANGCGPKISTDTITQPAVLTSSVASQTNVMCYGDASGAISVTVSGGTKMEVSTGVYDYKYAWNGPSGFTSTAQNLTGLAAGNYTLTITDKNNCTTILNDTITQNTAIVIDTTTTPITCYGKNNASITIAVSGGVTPYNIHWSNLATGTSLTNLSAGVYTVTVTDAVNCEKTLAITIPEARLFTIVPSVKNVTCYGEHNGSIKLNILGSPISVTWSDGSTAGNERNNLGPGTYSAEISDGTPCLIDTTFIITQPLALTVSGAITNALDCSNVNSGSITQTVAGGTAPYTYSWSNGATTKDLSSIPAGTYVVTVTDANGCVQTVQYTVSRPDPVNVSVSTSYDYNCTTKYLQELLTAVVTGGVPPYKIVWSSGTPVGTDSTVVSTTLNGLFIVNVTDSRGCSANYTVTSNVPTLGMELSLLDCNNKLYSYNTALVNTSTENYTFLWDFGDGSTSTKQSGQHTYSAAGTYTVKLTVAGQSCTSNYQETLYVADPPTLLITPDPQFCKGDSLEIYVSGANTYKWNNGSTLDSLLLTEATQYSVTGTSEQGCTSTLTFNSEYYDTSVYPISTDKDQVLVSNPTVHLWSVDQTGIYYFWNFGDSVTSEGYDQTHTYTVRKEGYFDVSLWVTNTHGCKSESTKRLWIVNDNEFNTFTPNGDGYNDTFLKGWHIKVYNRNGILMFEGNDGWDGTHDGKLVSADTYFYVVYYMSASGIKTKEGYVTVIR